MNNSINNLQSENTFQLPACNSKQEWGFIHRYGKIAELVLNSYTDKVYSDNIEVLIAQNVPIMYYPYSINFCFTNGNWENDVKNNFLVNFKNNGNGTCNITLTPLQDNVASGAYIYCSHTYILI